MFRVAIIGGGPAGLMAADQLSTVNGIQVDVFEAMPSVGRKFLMAGKGGMNITHAEPLPSFLSRYRAPSLLHNVVTDFPPDTLRRWMEDLGVTSFVGTSGRVFPEGMKAAPLLRAWLHRLRERGVRIHVRHRWTGRIALKGLAFSSPEGEQRFDFDAVILALGGGSWPQLGSDGLWVSPFQAQGLTVTPLQPSNCGFDVVWSQHLVQQYAGAALKTVKAAGRSKVFRSGEFNVTKRGVEGGLIYALSAELRDEWLETGQATLWLDLLPDHAVSKVSQALQQPRGRDSIANHLRRRLGLYGVKTALLREFAGISLPSEPELLANLIKALPIPLRSPHPLDEAISSAGGLCFSNLDEYLMLNSFPGVFCAGEMLDWEAPTGGYLLTACFATGHRVAQGVVNFKK